MIVFRNVFTLKRKPIYPVFECSRAGGAPTEVGGAPTGVGGAPTGVLFLSKVFLYTISLKYECIFMPGYRFLRI